MLLLSPETIFSHWLWSYREHVHNSRVKTLGNQMCLPSWASHVPSDPEMEYVCPQGGETRVSYLYYQAPGKSSA